MIASPLFTSFNDARMSSTNALNFVDYGLRAKMLGDAIPAAESFAAGANATEGVGGNVNLQDCASDDWPRWKDGRPVWLHSDVKDVSYFYMSSRCYYFRIRARHDAQGRLVSCHYGKIYGDFKIGCWLREGGCSVEFLYYLNPVSLDRNLEWDRKNNGFVGECPHDRLP